jgi:diacylglycerol kinase family enzyme
VGVGRANRRPFLFNIGIGFDAAVIRRVERYGELKRYLSHPLHIAAAFDAFFHKEGTRTHVDVELDTGEVIGDVRFAIVSKTDPYTFLGRRPLAVAPDAGLDRPLALTAFRALDAVTLLGSAASAMRTGRFLAHRRGVDHRQDLHRLIVRSGEPFAYQVDGDDAGDTEQLDIEYEPDALTVVVP